ncbi:hypothetical protein C0J52_20326, partial [Blattella germanica]
LKAYSFPRHTLSTESRVPEQEKHGYVNFLDGHFQIANKFNETGWVTDKKNGRRHILTEGKLH